MLQFVFNYKTKVSAVITNCKTNRVQINNIKLM